MNGKHFVYTFDRFLLFIVAGMDVAVDGGLDPTVQEHIAEMYKLYLQAGSNSALLPRNEKPFKSKGLNGFLLCVFCVKFCFFPSGCVIL